MRKLLLLLAALVAALFVLTACGGGKTSHTTESIVFEVNSTQRLVNGDGWVDVKYLGNGEWQCVATNYGDLSTGTCVSVVEGTTNFFWGVEKIGTTDVNHVGELTPQGGWHIDGKG